MKNVVEIKNLSFSYGTEEVIKKVDFEVKMGAIITIVGNTGGGKTTLVKLLLDLLHGTGTIRYFDQKENADKKQVMREIGVAIGNSRQNFLTNSVLRDLVFPLENLQLKKEQIDHYLNDIVTLFELEELQDKNPQELNDEQAAIVSIACALITKPKLLILDDAFMYIGAYWKKKIYHILKTLNREYHLTILNVTHDIEECLLGKKMYVLHYGRIVLEIKTSELSRFEKELKEYHYLLPFMVELSEKLKYYDVIDHTILDMNRMVNTIWK